MSDHSICYIDAAVRNNTGHHSNACRYFGNELRRRGFIVCAHGNRSLDPAIAQELGIEPTFQHYPYHRLRGGAYLSYLVERGSFLADLKRVWAHGPYDVIFFYSVMAAQLGAIGLWLQEFDPSKMPFVVVGFDLPSGNKLTDQWNVYAAFYRKAARLFDSSYLCRTLLFTFDPVTTEDYTELLKLPVQTMPNVFGGIREPRLRKRDDDGLVNIAFLGHQRPEKGYRFIPEIIRQLVDQRAPVRFLLHNSAPENDVISCELRAMASASKNITLIEKSGDHSLWQDLLDQSDMVVLPYEPGRYRESGSGVATEAVSDGIPIVMPSGTTMEALAINFQGCATAFPTWQVDAIVNAILRALANFETLARRAEMGAIEWRRENGARVFVDRLLEYADLDKKFCESKRPRRRKLGGLANSLLSRLARYITSM